MGAFDLLAVVVFFLIGYWIVDYFWPGKKKDAGDKGNPQDREPPGSTN